MARAIFGGMSDDNAVQLLQAQIEDLRAREKVIRRTVKEQREQIDALRARLSPRERLRDALEACPACGPPSEEELAALTDEEVAARLASHT